MFQLSGNGRSTAVRTFSFVWLVGTAVPVVYTLGSIHPLTVAMDVSADLLLILAPNLPLAALAGFLLGPRIRTGGFLRSLGWQVIHAFLWACLFTLWLFALLFEGNSCRSSRAPSRSAPSTRLLSARLLEALAVNCALLIPVTLLASGIVRFLLRRQIRLVPFPS